MKKAAVSKLKASLSEYLKKVKAGEEILITEHGKPVAKMVPIAREDAVPERLRELEKQGLIKLGHNRLPDGFWDMPRPLDKKGIALKALLEEREESR
ncbi:MAG: type II toxin-antitoxin system prevent-host-death family antitoxin [Actinobacteria bacterium]|nr:type II toxin-antitoxin system prevent-host-death family antitoxin [Actinomycetota bacterium]